MFECPFCLSKVLHSNSVDHFLHCDVFVVDAQKISKDLLLLQNNDPPNEDVPNEDVPNEDVPNDDLLNLYKGVQVKKTKVKATTPTEEYNTLGNCDPLPSIFNNAWFDNIKSQEQNLTIPYPKCTICSLENKHHKYCFNK